MKLDKLIENPDNPSKASDEQLKRLEGKLIRVKDGLTANRIAYITDKGDKFVVLSGNKRLRLLKKMYGEDGEVPDEWFQDITSMSEAERHEFIVDSNIADGEWDVDKLLEQYDKEELIDYGLDDIANLFPDGDLQQLIDDNFMSQEETQKEKDKNKKTITCPDCGKVIEI